MATILITKESNGYDIMVYTNNKPVRKVWAMNLQQAYGKADILADYYTDDNGQRAAIVDNTKKLKGDKMINRMLINDLEYFIRQFPDAKNHILDSQLRHELFSLAVAFKSNRLNQYKVNRIQELINCPACCQNWFENLPEIKYLKEHWQTFYKLVNL